VGATSGVWGQALLVLHSHRGRHREGRFDRLLAVRTAEYCKALVQGRELHLLRLGLVSGAALDQLLLHVRLVDSAVLIGLLVDHLLGLLLVDHLLGRGLTGVQTKLLKLRLKIERRGLAEVLAKRI